MGFSAFPTLEGLEAREMLSAAPIEPPGLSAAIVAQVQAQSNLLQNLDVNITDLSFNEAANQIVATFDLSGTLAGRDFTLEDLQVPIDVSILENENGECPILHLELHIPDLNILGLHVQLDNCDDEPVTLDIVAVEGQGLLGDLLCGLTNADGTLGDLLGGLEGLGATLDDLTEELTGVLNDTLDQILGMSGGVAAASHQDNGNDPRRCDLVNLELGELNLNVLGLEVRTSEICLDVFAQRGGAGNGGGLLGNLLCTVSNLLNNPGNTGNAVNNLLDRVFDRIDDLL
jgi:hypothetical protein